MAHEVSKPGRGPDVLVGSPAAYKPHLLLEIGDGDTVEASENGRSL